MLIINLSEGGCVRAVVPKYARINSDGSFRRARRRYSTLETM